MRVWNAKIWKMGKKKKRKKKKEKSAMLLPHKYLGEPFKYKIVSMHDDHKFSKHP